MMPPPPPANAAPWNRQQSITQVRAVAPDNDGELDEKRVAELIEESRNDWQDTMLSPFWGYIQGHPARGPNNPLQRHYKRHLAVAGTVSKVKNAGKRALTLLGTGIALCLGAAYLQQHTFWFVVWPVAGIFGALVWMFSAIPGKYHAAFFHIYVHERGDYTDLTQVTRCVELYLPRLGFYNKPDVWRGNDLQDSWTDKGAVGVLVTGVDEVTPLPGIYDDDSRWEKDVWCSYTEGRMVEDFRTAAEFYELDADPYMMTGVTAVMRRVFCRELWNSGDDFRQLEKGGPKWYDGRMGLIIGGVAGAIGVLTIALS